MKAGYIVWGKADTERLFEMRDVQKMEYSAISKALNRSASSCMSQYSNVRLRMRKHSANPRHTKCPDDLFLEREQRNAARLTQSETGRAFGDPPPGFSALEQRVLA
jgi:hypothetical protein